MHFEMQPKILSRSLVCLASVVFCLAASTAMAQQAAVPAQVTVINNGIEEGWNDYEIKPAPEVDDSTWCRRVFLGCDWTYS